MSKIFLFFVLSATLHLGSVLCFSQETYIIKFKNNINEEKLKNSTLAKLITPIIDKKMLDEKSEKVQALNNNPDFSELKKYYKITSTISKDSLFSVLNKEYEIEFIEPNYIYKIEQTSFTPNDPLFPEQWALQTVKAENAWVKSSGEGITVGIIDTGIDWEHLELTNQMLINSKEDINKTGKFEAWASTESRNGIYGDINNIDEDGNGYIDDVIGYDFVDQDVSNFGDYFKRDPIPTDEMGHGTQVAGVIAAQTNNNIGVAGLAFNSKLIALRAFDVSGNAETDDIASAIIYAGINKIKVVNMSFGEMNHSLLMKDACRFAASQSCVLVASSGNNGWSKPHYPSDYNEVISVGASTSENERYYRSNYGARVALLAPGYDVLTTAPGNDYKKSSGTSFSAPYVSAAAALLLQLDSTLSKDEIVGTLKASAIQIEDNGYYTGTGLLNADKAVHLNGKSNVTLYSPENNAVINRTKITRVPIIAEIITPLFDRYDLMLGAGRNPYTWGLLARVDNQTKKDTIFWLETKDLQDTVYTVAIIVHQKNGKLFEERINLNITSNSNNLSIISVNCLNAVKNEKNILVVAVTTNQECTVNVKYRPAGSEEEYRTNTYYDYCSQFHTIQLSDEILADTDYTLVVTATRSDGNSTKNYSSFKKNSETFPTDKFNKKKYSLPPAYLFNQVVDLYGDNNPTIALNDLYYGYWNSVLTYQFKNEKFVLRDSLKSSWIPIGFGDSNGDGILEILTKKLGMTTLFQSANKIKRPFDNILFTEQASDILTGAGMCDFTGDGRAEIITYSDSLFHIFGYNGADYKMIAQTNPSRNLRDVGTSPGVIFGDFDNDGNIELCHSNDEGYLFIYKFVNNNLVIDYIDSTAISNSSQLLYAADIDNDGTPEIIHGNFGSKMLFGYEDAGTVIWQFRIIKNSAPNKYEPIWNKFFWGVRSGPIPSGVTFRNGLSAGDIDGIDGDELIISPFPNLYVYKWDTDAQTMKCMWHTGNAFTNSALIYDFDKNGINEFGYSDGNATYFYEYDKTFDGPDAPTDLDGWASNSNTAYLQWKTSKNASYYQVFKVIRTDTSAFVEFIGETSASTFSITDLPEHNWFEYTVRAVNPNLPYTVSDFSYSIEIYTHTPAQIKKITVVNKNQLDILFTERVKGNAIEPLNFTLLNPNGESYTPKTVIIGGDSNYIASFENALIAGTNILSHKELKDYYRSPIVAASHTFTIEPFPVPEEEMYLTGLTILTNYKLQIGLTHNIDANTCLNVANYSISPFGEIISVDAVEGNPQMIYINLNPEKIIGALGHDYSITAKNIFSDSGVPITKGAGNTVNFVFSADNLNDAFVYPNPIKYSDKPSIFFANLPNNSTVIIQTFEGQNVKTLEVINGNGGVEWNGLDNDGNYLRSGIYLFKVKAKINNKEEESDYKKFIVIGK